MLALQSADGWFAETFVAMLTESGHDALALEAQVMATCNAALPTDILLRSRVAATVTMVAALHTWFSDRRDLWRRAEAKARRWLAATKSVDAAMLDLVIAGAKGTK